MVRYIPDRSQTHRVAAETARRDVDRVLDETLRLARSYVPVRAPRIGDKRPTGRLKASLRKRGPRVLATRVVGSIGSTLPFAASVHEGAKAHAIVARRHPRLQFFWERKGVSFIGFKVNHPGVSRRSRTQYLLLPLALAGRRNGFVVRRTATDISSSLSGI